MNDLSFADDSEKVALLQAQLTSKDVELTVARVASSLSTNELNAMSRAHVSLKSELDVLHAAEERRVGVLRDFVERICTGYSELIGTLIASYRNWLNALLSGAQSNGEYVEGCRICVGKDGYSLSIDEATRDEEPGDRLFSPKSGEDDIIEVVVQPSNRPPPTL